MTRQAHFEIVKRPKIVRRDKTGDRLKVAQTWHWRIIGANGRILASSETYLSRASCVKAIDRARGAELVVKK